MFQHAVPRPTELPQLLPDASKTLMIRANPATNAAPLTHAVCQRRIVQRAALQHSRVHAPGGWQLPSALLPAGSWGEVGGVEARCGGGLRDKWKQAGLGCPAGRPGRLQQQH